MDLATLGTTLTLIFNDGRQEVEMLREQPLESEIEVAVLRLRPLFLEEDEVFHGKVTTALGLLAPAEEQPHIKRLKNTWHALPKAKYWSLDVVTGLDSATGWRSDRQIAADWFYGHLFHHDVQRRERVRNVPHDDLVHAGLLWAKDGILLTEVTRRYLSDLRDAGALA